MNWVVRIADDAQVFIDHLPAKIRRQVSRSISQLEQDPFQGDVKALQGRAWKGYYCKRTGDYRIIFFVHHSQRIVDVSWVLLRSDKTYHKFRQL
jgi:mRNA-degrading endonuclease RelE of RelBE toxin-antitoxin system